MTKKKIDDLPDFDVAAHLDTPERQAAYIAAVLEDGEPDEIKDAIGNVARARGMAEIAASANLNPKSLYRSLCAKGNPEFTTIFKVLAAMGYTLTIKQQDAA